MAWGKRGSRFDVNVLKLQTELIRGKAEPNSTTLRESKQAPHNRKVEKSKKFWALMDNRPHCYFDVNASRSDVCTYQEARISGFEVLQVHP